MRVSIAFAVLTLLANSAVAEHKIALVQPKTTDLVVAKVVRENDLYAEFRGTTRITGTLVAEWAGGRKNLNYKEPDYSLVPDAESINQLPHFSGYRVRFIEIQNGREALTLAAGNAVSNRLLERKISRATVTGVFDVSNFAVGIECDASWAKATLVSARIPNPKYAAKLPPIETC